MVPRQIRERLWDAQYDEIEAQLEQKYGHPWRDGVGAVPVAGEPLLGALLDLKDQRCESCGRFEDDPADPHAEWCHWSRCPRPSLDPDSRIPVAEQLRQILSVLRLQW
jgi:hypothetical protein